MNMSRDRRPVVLEDNIRMLDWTAQDTLEAIMGMEPDGEDDEALLDFLEGSSTADRLAVSGIIAESNVGQRHLIEAVVEQTVSDSQQRLKEILEEGQGLPAPGDEDLKAINNRRMSRDIVGINIDDLDPGGKLQDRLMNASLEDQDEINRAIQETVAENGAGIKELKKRMLQTLEEKLAG